MILAEAATSWVPGIDGLVQIALMILAGGATVVLLPKDKVEGGEKTTTNGRQSLLSRLPSRGSSKPAGPPSVGEAYDLLERLDTLSPDLVEAYGESIEEARKKLTWKREKPKPTEGQTSAAA